MTSALIGILEDDGRVSSAYLSLDGYLDSAGFCLVKNWQDEDRIRELISLNYIYALGIDMSSTQPIGNADVANEDPADLAFRDEDGFWSSVFNWDASYAYLFKNGKWNISPKLVICSA